ncbi:hypothetical protein [Magnetospirillum sp. UT-4]|uniref:hypothetical protein n=1 Tax=Magnetospirillum sp. UT-4 TaxID=2681467 RepID=UPI001380E8F6|nr:hypothetical protein [Magnetospirillum sp. UT-4]CAA7615388.1 conserved exported hypothetical protein [Magnetospirillum sp. UT-4]
MRPLAAALLLLLAACSSEATIAPDFGAAVHFNMAAQTLPPPPAADDVPAGQDGGRAGEAWERYRTGKTIPPVSLSTSEGLIRLTPAK